jgi:hypothetical protein
VLGVSNPPKSPDSSVDDPETIFDMFVIALLLLIPKVPLSLIFEPAGGGYALVVPRALDILPILTSEPVDGITPILYK